MHDQTISTATRRLRHFPRPRSLLQPKSLRRAALAATTMLASAVPVLFVPWPSEAQIGTVSGANSNPNAGQSGAGLEAAGRAAAAQRAIDAGATPQAGPPIPGSSAPGSSAPASSGSAPQVIGTQGVAPGTAGSTTQLPMQAPSTPQPAAAATSVAPESASTVLMQQASFWHNQSQNGRAMEALQRALALDPNNPDALALVAEIQIEQGNAAQANAALQKLRTIRPNDPHIAQIDRALRIGQISPTALAEARRLSQEGRNAEAVQRYQQIFRGNPPPDSLAVEYYQTLSGTEGGWERSRDGLAQIVRDNPSDLRAQLAYAQLLTYREGARTEGIARLAQLSQNPVVADQASKSWRQSLAWLPVATASVPPLNLYLQRYPNDTSVQRMLEAAKNPPQGPPDTIGEARVAGFRSLNGNDLSNAERGFETALAANPNDADALGGLGLVRLRQGRTAEGRTLLQRAIAADPSKRGQWQAALSGGDVPAEYAAIRTATNRGDYAGAERQIRALMGRGNNSGLQMMLADVQARRGDTAAAEATYRSVLASSPRNNQAMIGLAGVLQQEGHAQEAEALLAQAGATGSLRALAQARAQQLRDQATLVADPATKIGLLRAALASDPGSPWIRLDLARALSRQGQMAEARALMDQVSTGNQSSTDGLQAAIIFANETGQTAQAAALIERVPAGRRTTDMRAALAQAQINRDIQAAMAYPPEVARQRLLALAAAAPDPDGTRGAAIARALNRLGDPNGARAAITTAQAVTRGGTGEQRINYAGALMDVGDPAGAQRLLASVNPSQLSATQRTAATSLNDGLTVRSSDQLNQVGRRADAYDQLAPVLQRNPDSAPANLALARLYTSADEPKQALAINLAVLRRDPSNVDARNAAVNAAIAAGDRSTADRLVREGLQLYPNDPRAWITSADLARARGNNLRAIQDLERARQLRLQQIGGSDAGADYSTGDPFASGVSGDVAPRGGATLTLAPNAPPIYANTPPSTPAARPYPLLPGAAPPPSPYAQTSYQPYASGGAPQYMPAQYRPVQYQPAQYQPVQYQPAQYQVPAYPAAPSRAPAYQPVQYQPAQYQPAQYQPAQYQPAPYQQYQPAQYVAPGYPATAYPAPAYTAPAYAAPAPLYPPSRPVAPIANPTYPGANPPAFAPPAYTPPSTVPPSYVPPAYVSPAYPGVPATYPAVQPQFSTTNPFRTGGESAFGSTTVPIAQQDPLTQQIDQSIVALRNQIAPTLQAGVLVRGRSGTSGLDQLTEVAGPIEATFSPAGVGTLRLLAQPTYLNAGTLGANPITQSRIGTQALALVPNGTTVPTLGSKIFGTQEATGVGLDAGYKYGWFAGDVGTTPLGFRFNRLIGGVEIAPKFTDNLTLRLTGERRGVIDSLLSYGGQKDPRTGIESGGVTRTRGYAQLEMTAGLANLYLGGGYAALGGENVQENYETQAGAGGSYPVYRNATDELRLGIDLVYFGFAKTLAGFTLGQGGYFSPQSYVAGLVPVNWSSKPFDNFTYAVGGSLGYQVFHDKSSPYYPGNPGLQAQLDSIAAGVPGLQTTYPGRNTEGVTGIVHAAAEYSVTPQFKVGASASYQHAGDYNEGQGLLYARYIFNGAE